MEFRRLKAAFVAHVKGGPAAPLDPDLLSSGLVPELDIVQEVVRRMTGEGATELSTIVALSSFGTGPCNCKKCK